MIAYTIIIKIKKDMRKFIKNKTILIKQLKWVHSWGIIFLLSKNPLYHYPFCYYIVQQYYIVIF